MARPTASAATSKPPRAQSRTSSSTTPPTFLERFWEHVGSQPNTTALVSDSAQVTYGELGQRVAAMADALHHFGVRTGDRIGIYRERDGDAVIEIIAVLSCGATYVPIDLRSPATRLTALVAEADLTFVITSEFALPIIESNIAHDCVLLVSTLREFADRKRSERMAADPALVEDRSAFRAVDATSLAYIMHTSGSTGTPKGVPIAHANLASLLAAWDDVMGDTHERSGVATASPRSNHHRSLLLSSLSFDASVAELFWPLASGGTLVVAPDPAHAAFEVRLGAFIVRHRVTHLQCTPTRATLMLSDEEDRKALARIEHLVIGGEALPRVLAQALLQAGIQRLTNAYGPTEATVWATSCEVTPELLEATTSVVPVGRPLKGVSLLVVDERGVEVGLGEVGELVLGGPFVSEGYFQKPELCALSFADFAFSGVTMHGYRTGDLASRRSDGLLDFHGRIDHQVKIRGHRIELGEIEAILASDATVAHAAVCVDPNRSTELVAFVVAKDGASIDPVALGNRMRRRLPAVMIPRRFIVVDSLPKTTSEKVDRSRLVTELNSRTVEKTTVTESLDTLAEMMSDFSVVLDRDSVGPDEDFFELGGHSLLSVELVTRIETRTGIRVPIRNVLRAPTARQLNALVDGLRLLDATSPTGGDPSEDYTNLLVRFGRTSDQRSSRKLYLVHGASGNVLRFHAIARELKDLVEVIGVQAAGLEGNEVPDPTIAAMVGRYADLIERDNPGPTVELGGFSFGGLLALHLAAELFRRGKTLRSLVLIDSFESNEVSRSRAAKLVALADNARHRQGLSLVKFGQAALEGWTRRREWDQAATEVARSLGYNDLFDHNSRLLDTVETAPLVNAPALLVRSAVENPFRKRTYHQALHSPREVRQVWIRGKHDEIFSDGHLAELHAAIRNFLAHW